MSIFSTESIRADATTGIEVDPNAETDWNIYRNTTNDVRDESDVEQEN